MEISERVLEALSAIKRQDFLPDEAKKYVGLNEPLHIGYNQTNSQPSTVAFTINLLDVQRGNKILDVGSGSGWTTALLAYLTGSYGYVVGVEKVPHLVKFGLKNLLTYQFDHATIIQSLPGVLGYPEGAPYDRILVSASSDKMPKELISQLKKGGKMVIPVRNSIFLVEKHPDGSIDTEEYPGFAFVPLVE